MLRAWVPAYVCTSMVLCVVQGMLTAALSTETAEGHVTEDSLFGVPRNELPLVHGLLLAVRYIFDEVEWNK